MKDHSGRNFLWITWERQTRNRSASAYIGAPLFEIIETTPNRIVRYVKSIKRTLSVIKKNNPRTIFAQNPSVILALLVILIKFTTGRKVVIDAHNSGIYGPEDSLRLIKFLNSFIIRNADATIVTNELLQDYVNEIGGHAVVLPDPLPIVDLGTKYPEILNKNGFNALCITSWSSDEPFYELLKATERFEGDVNFYFSGNFKKAQNLSIDKIPENVNLLGFISEELYFQHLDQVDFCIDLTQRNDCMVCGAYESLAYEKPIILSNSDVQRNYFKKGAIFCSNDCNSISEAISEMKNNIQKMKADAVEFKKLITARESELKPEIIKIIECL